MVNGNATWQVYQVVDWSNLYTVYSIFTVQYHWDDLDLSDGPLDMVNKQLLQMQSPGTLQLVKLLCVVRPCL